MRHSLGGLSTYRWALPRCRSRRMGRGPFPSPQGPDCAPARTDLSPARSRRARQCPARPPDGDQSFPAGLARRTPGAVGAAPA